MATQGHPEPSGTAWVSGGYHLPSRLVVHTVGPIVQGRVPGPRDEQALASCYTSCLDAAEASGARSIAFCSISTGLFGYPVERAAPVALGTVETWLERRRGEMHVVFNTFSASDTLVYRKALAEWSMR